MDHRLALTIPFFFCLTTLTNAEPEDMTVSTWSAGCEHTMTTNHFELGPGQSVELDLDLSGCNAERLGGLLYFGYKTTKNSSRPLTARDKILLTLVNNVTGQTTTSSDGSIFAQVDDPGSCRLYAENFGRKTTKIRLRSSAGL